MMQFQVSITKKEYKKISLHFLFKKLWFLKIIIPAILLNFLFTSSVKGFTAHSFFDSILMPLLVMAAILIIFNISINRNIKKAFNTHPLFNETINYTVDENGMYVKGESFEGRVSWNMYDYVWVKGDFLVFLQNATFGNIIPKRNLTPEQLNQLLQYVRNANLQIKGIKG